MYNRFGNSPSEQKPDEYSLGVQVEYLNHVPEHYQPEILPCARTSSLDSSVNKL